MLLLALLGDIGGIGFKSSHQSRAANIQPRVAILAFFKPKTTNLAFFESVWLANFLLAFWLFYHRKFEIWVCPFCDFHCFRNTTLCILKPGNQCSHF